MRHIIIVFALFLGACSVQKNNVRCTDRLGVLIYEGKNKTLYHYDNELVRFKDKNGVTTITGATCVVSPIENE